MPFNQDMFSLLNYWSPNLSSQTAKMLHWKCHLLHQFGKNEILLMFCPRAGWGWVGGWGAIARVILVF